MNKKLANTVSANIKNLLSEAANGKKSIRYTPDESNLFGEGVSLRLGEDRALSITPNERNISTLTPRASVLIKKKAFSTFKHVNDLQWMDRTEKMLLRSTKALFSYKVAQVRAYESLTKNEEFYSKTSEINLSLLADLISNARFLDIDDFDQSRNQLSSIITTFSNSLRDASYDKIKEGILLLMERNAFASELPFTTWIVDPNNVDNYETGPGTGVIEIGMFSSFNTSCNLNIDPSSAELTLEDPYRIMNITESDIEIAIKEALFGTLGLLNELSNEGSPPIDTRSAVGAGLELLGTGIGIPGLGRLDRSIDVDYIRDRMRIFYLGKPIINAGDAVHYYIRGNKTAQNFTESENIFDRDFLSVDESILEAERILYTNSQVDFDTYKNLRQFSDSSFGMKHVFGGFVTRTSETWNNGSWTMRVSCTDNMGWLQWSRFMIEPALQDPQGILEDPLTPYEVRTDDAGIVLSAGGPELLDENKQLIKSGLLFYDSGILNGQIATENNLFQGQYNRSGSLSGTKILQHPQGLVYRWKQGIVAATAGITITDPYSETQVTQKIHNQTYGLTVAEDVLNNLDIANILSILIVGQPYNVQTFIDQAYMAHNIGRGESASSMSADDPLSAVLDVIRRQNIHIGNFKPYRLITMSKETLFQTANTNILRNNLNGNIEKLQNRRAQLDALIRRLGSSEAPGSGILLNSLREERRSVNDGIFDQVKTLEGSGAVSSVDLVTQNFNLFGRGKDLPITGNYSADHEITRAMTIVGAQRKIEDVRLNRDQNLFIVSDQYDEQTDIRPFIFKLRDNDFKIFKGDFISIYDKCQAAANYTNLEIFCNTEGHLEFRPPQWNKTPLSILQRLFEINQESDKKIVPAFLTEIFSSRTDSLTREIHSLNIRIVLLALLLNSYPDKTLIPNFSIVVGRDILLAGSGKGKESLRFFGVRQGRPDASLALRDGNSQIGIGNRLINTIDQVVGSGLNLEAGLGKRGQILNGDTTTLLGVFDPLFQESKGLVSNVLNAASKASGENALKIAKAANLNELRESFIKISGIDPASDLVTDNGKFQDSDFIFNNNSTSSTRESDNITKANNYLKKLEQTLSNRDRLVVVLQRNLEKEQELEEVESILAGEFTAESIPQAGGSQAIEDFNRGLDSVIDVLNRTSNTVKTISDIFTGDATKGTLFDHLIADDGRNMTGPGSGRRYIIRDEDIISCTFTEEPPDAVRVDVVGDAPIIGNGLNQAFNDRYFWAGATDFDLWRQYGYKYPGSKNLPFSNDAEQQSKPWAILELQLQRLKINQASIDVIGNEYYEPGDVVYVESKQLLYYVRSVSHSFTFGQAFSTSLTLEFGHPPGVYLPSPLDIIGQQYIKEPVTGTFTTYRNSRGDDSYRTLQPDSAIVFPQQRITQDNLAVLLDHKNNAVRFTNMMADLSSILIGNRVVLIRGFVKGRNTEDEERVRENIKTIKDLMQNPVSLSQTNPTSTTDDIADTVSSAVRGLGKPAGTTKTTRPMILPNGLPVISIPSDKIAEQIVFLDNKDTYSEIQTMNPNIPTSQFIDGKEVNFDDYEAIFPKGGPKQRTWLDIRNQNNVTRVVGLTTFNVSNVIEIGILDIDRAIKTKVKAR